MDLLFLDLETTGLNPKTDEIIQLAYSLNDESNIYSHLYCPQKEIPYEVSGLTNIDRGDVKDKPKFEDSDEIKKLKKFTAKEHIAITHNTDFDLGFLRQYGIFFKKSVCTLYVSKKMIPTDLSNHKLGTLRAYFGIHKPSDLNPHNAKYDVEVLKEVFNRLRENFSSIEKMIKYEKQARLDELTTWKFGKFRGEKISKEKHGDYIEWFLSQPPNPQYPHDPKFILYLNKVLKEENVITSDRGKLF